MTMGPVPTPPPVRLAPPATPGTEDEQLLQSIPSPAERAQAVQVSDSWRVLRIMGEFVWGFDNLADVHDAVCVFGSARTRPGDKYYEAATRMSRLFAEAGIPVITGGGPGIMEAANKGAVEGNGLSIGGVVAPAEIMDSYPALGISTFGGNPLATAGALANLDYLLDNDLQTNSLKVGNRLMQNLVPLSEELDVIGEVRGKGLMIGLEFHPDAGGARQYCQKLMRNGLLCKETHEHIIRFAPPLVITQEIVDWALERIGRVVTE